MWDRVPNKFPPRIVQQSDRVRGVTGQEVCLIVSANANPTPQYTWRLNGIPVADGNFPELRLRPFEVDQIGRYDVVVKNALGEIESAQIDVAQRRQRFFEPLWKEYFYEGTPGTIPSERGAFIDAPIDVEESFDLSSVRVWLDIEHNDSNDLSASLIAPNKNVITLFIKPDRRGRNFDHTLFDDQAPETIEDGVAPFYGTYRPEQSLNQRLAGSLSTGTWTLRVTNETGDASGRLKAWGLGLWPDEAINFDAWKMRAESFGDTQATFSNYVFAGGAYEPTINDGGMPPQWVFKQWLDAEDLNYHYEISQDLVKWKPAVEGLDFNTAKREIFSDRTEAISLLATEMKECQFLRLKVQRQ